MENILLSAILPTYNMEKSLRKCLESIQRQSYQHFEVIIVVDGATDSSYAIAQEFEKEDIRFHAVWQKNAGSGPARNNGLNRAKGEVIMFVDPDDWIDADMFKHFIEAYQQEKPDLILSGYTENYESNGKMTETVLPLKQEKFYELEAVRKAYLPLYFDEAVSAPTRKLYKKKIIDKFAVEFPALRRSQDIVFNYRYYRWIESAVVISDVSYHYRVDDASYLLKLKEGYDITIAILFNGILEMHEFWGMEIPAEEMKRLLNRFFTIVCYYIESCIMQSISFDTLLKNQTICYIVRNAEPLDIYHKCLQSALRNNNMRAVRRIIHVKIFVKKNMKSMFSRLRQIRKF